MLRQTLRQLWKQQTFNLIRMFFPLLSLQTSNRLYRPLNNTKRNQTNTLVNEWLHNIQCWMLVQTNIPWGTHQLWIPHLPEKDRDRVGFSQTSPLGASHPVVVRVHAPVGIYPSRLIYQSEDDMYKMNVYEELHHFQYERCSIPWIINSCLRSSVSSIQQKCLFCLSTIIRYIHPAVQKGSEEDKVPHYAEGQRESAVSGASVAFEAPSDQSHLNNAAGSCN